MKKRLLIFGADGFVGPYIAREFSASGYSVIGSDLKSENKKKDFEAFFECDLLDIACVDKIISLVKPSHIINLAAISSVGISWKIPQKTISINVNGTINILETVRISKLQTRILLVGSSEEYRASSRPLSENDSIDANNPYGVSKIAQENFAWIYKKNYDLKINTVRSFNHTGIGQSENFVIPSFCKQVADIERSGNSGEICVGNLDIVRDFCNVKDIAKAYRLVLEDDDCNTIYNIGSGKSESLRNILNYIVSLCSQEVKIIIDEEKWRPTDNPFICCDNSLIKNKLGWEPKIDIFQTVKEIYQNYL